MRKFRSVVLEALGVAFLGLIVALVANAVSPRGLKLSRNYFHGATKLAAASTNVPAGDAVIERLRQRGLQAASRDEVVALFREPGYQQGLIVFIDARNDHLYQGGHIPGAWQFDHYRAEQFLPIVMPVCLNAQKVIIYCGGGECEDSEFAAITLRDAGVPADKIHVYTGGMKDWQAQKLPLEHGSKDSGDIRQ
jgi:rhodanese-related sulfurtransferase